MLAFLFDVLYLHFNQDPFRREELTPRGTYVTQCLA